MVSVTTQSNTIVLNEVKDNQVLLELRYRKNNALFGQLSRFTLKVSKHK